jgi:predicted TIM-barrel fold metal-dependent hydrolase
MAQTPWGELAVGDAHVHFFSHRFYAALAQQKHAESAEALVPLLGWEIPGADDWALADKWVAELDKYGIAQACLIASAHGDEASVAAAVARRPDRFFGYFMLDPSQADALDRVKAAALNPSLHAICLFPAMHRVPVTDARLVPVFEAAAEHHLAVFVHCGALSVGVRKKLGLASPFDMRLSNPLDLHPVAVRFPQIRFVIPHFGAGMLREALLLADLCPNVYFDTSSSNRWMMYEGLDLRTVFRRALDVVGPGRLMFGSDSSFFPRGWHAAILEHQGRALYELGVVAADASKIVHGNLAALHTARKAKFVS